MKEAMFYKKGENQEVNCFLCHHRCTIKQGKKGICGVRENREGTLYSLVFGKSISESVDPIEKKTPFPFFSRVKLILNSHSGMQFQMSPLPEFQHFANAKRPEVYCW